MKWELVSTIGGYKDSLLIIAKIMDYLRPENNAEIIAEYVTFDRLNNMVEFLQ